MEIVITNWYVDAHIVIYMYIYIPATCFFPSGCWESGVSATDEIIGLHIFAYIHP